MSAVEVVLAVFGVAALLGVVLYLLWPRASDLGELARIKAEEQLALWHLQSLGRDAAERLRRAHGPDRK